MSLDELLSALAWAVEVTGMWLLEKPEGKVLLERLLERIPKLEGDQVRMALQELLAEAVAERIVTGWDRHGAPTAARTEEGEFLGSFEGPGGPYSVRAASKREAYQAARREWIRRMLAGG